MRQESQKKSTLGFDPPGTGTCSPWLVRAVNLAAAAGAGRSPALSRGAEEDMNDISRVPAAAPASSSASTVCHEGRLRGA